MDTPRPYDESLMAAKKVEEEKPVEYFRAQLNMSEEALQIDPDERFGDDRADFFSQSPDIQRATALFWLQMQLDELIAMAETRRGTDSNGKAIADVTLDQLLDKVKYDFMRVFSAHKLFDLEIMETLSKEDSRADEATKLFYEAYWEMDHPLSKNDSESFSKITDCLRKAKELIEAIYLSQPKQVNQTLYSEDERLQLSK